MRNGIVVTLLMLTAVLTANGAVSLDSCRNMAINNNKEIQIANERIKSAGYQKKEASAAYLPKLDLNASYFYNQKEISLFAEDQMLPTKSFNPATGQYDFNLVKGPDGMPIKFNDQYVPSTVAYLPKSALTYDIHNVFAGALTLTQPVFMGGKIRAMNEITKYAEELAKSMRNNAAQEVIYSVDVAYWQVVSLKAKEKLAKSYVQLLDTLNTNVNAMVKEGVATKADALSVAVKLNEANVDLTKVENGLSLSRMLLAQLCGQPVNTVMHLEDEDKDNVRESMPATSYNMDDVYARRQDVNALKIAVKIYEQKEKVALSTMLPNLAIVGMYSVTNPNSYNGYENKFGGAFSVGAMLSVPIWHWGGNSSKYKAAKSETIIKKYELANAYEKIELQVNQASFKVQEAVKTYNATKSNLEKANENLRMAQLGFKEGMLASDKVMEAQTAWLKANSEYIDSQIDVQLCNVYLSKVLGTMNY